MTTIIETFITFGVQYGTDPEKSEIHPLGMHRDGYAVIEAPDRDTALRIANAVFGHQWSFDYSYEDFMQGESPVARFHPDGELLRISWLTQEHIKELDALETRLVFGDKPADPEEYLPTPPYTITEEGSK